MHYNTFVFLAALILATANASSDQEHWIQQAEQNAKKNLDHWPEAVEAFVTGQNSKLVQNEIQFFQTQVGDSVGNMKEFVPKLVSVVNYINSTVAAYPNFFRRGILHSVLWYIEGKRDNKSYYLLDGAVNWVMNRLSVLSSKGGRAAELGNKLVHAKDAAANLRDELDSNAQHYVRNIAKIDELSGDICKNIEEIRVLARDLAAAFEKSTLLQSADAVNDLVKSIVL